MTPQQAYKEFLLKVNKNDTNANIKVPKSQFISLFNEQKDLFLEEKITLSENSDLIEDIQELLESSFKLESVKSSLLKDEFKLPEDFLRRATGYVIASKGECKNNPMVVWFIKPKNVDVYLQNSNLSPSFEYQETIAILNTNKVSIYKTDFNIDEAYLSYYRKAIPLDIEGYTNFDGTASKNQQTDLTDQNIRLVISRTALAALINYQDVESANLAAQRDK